MSAGRKTLGGETIVSQRPEVPDAGGVLGCPFDEVEMDLKWL